MIFGRSPGFVLTISVFVIVLFALLFTQEFVQKSQNFSLVFSRGFPMQKALFVSDNVGFEAAKLLQSRINVENSQSSTVVKIYGSMPSGISVQNLSGFKSFVENDFSSLNNADLSVDLAGVSDGESEVLFSNGLQYDFDYSFKDGRADFYSASPSVEISRIDLNLESSNALVDVNAWQWKPSGNLQVSLYYKDSQITVKASGKLDSNVLNTYSFNYEGGSLIVIAGSIEGKGRALRIEKDSDLNDSVNFSISSSFPLQDGLSYYYNAGLSFKQLGADVEAKIRPLSD